MKRFPIAAAAFLAAAFLVASSPTAASADGSGSSDAGADGLAQIVAKASPGTVAAANLRAAAAVDGTFVASGDVSVAMPKSSKNRVTASKSTVNGPVTVSVGTGAEQASDGQLASDGSVVYGAASAMAQSVQPTTDGFRIHSILKNPSAGTRVVHPVSLPAGARLVAEADMPEARQLPDGASSSGAVFVVSAAGDILGGFSAPWARDANGAQVPTRYEVQGADLVQTIDHRNPTTAYPVVADPYFGIDLIDHAKWTRHSEGWTLEVTPTWWARANAGGYLPGVYGWNELYSKYRHRGLDTNLDGMRKQYICHQQIVAIRAPNKPTWNLDEWRPNVSYWQTVNASCNPGGPRWFD